MIELSLNLNEYMFEAELIRELWTEGGRGLQIPSGGWGGMVEKWFMNIYSLAMDLNVLRVNVIVR